MFFTHLFKDYEKAVVFLQESRQLNSDIYIYIYIHTHIHTDTILCKAVPYCTHKPPNYNHKVLPLFMCKYTNLNHNWTTALAISLKLTGG